MPMSDCVFHVKMFFFENILAQSNLIKFCCVAQLHQRFIPPRMCCFPNAILPLTTVKSGGAVSLRSSLYVIYNYIHIYNHMHIVYIYIYRVYICIYIYIYLLFIYSIYTYVYIYIVYIYICIYIYSIYIYKVYIYIYTYIQVDRQSQGSYPNFCGSKPPAVLPFLSQPQAETTNRQDLRKAAETISKARDETTPVSAKRVGCWIQKVQGDSLNSLAKLVYLPK